MVRAAVLGATDGIVSVPSRVVGDATADPAPQAVLLAGVAGLAAGAVSMAAGEKVFVSSRSDIECADITREEIALADMLRGEFAELVAIFDARGSNN